MRDVVGYEGIFQVTEDGEIFSLRTNKFLIQGTTKVGYKIICTRVNGIAKSPRVHRMVAEAFIPNPDNKPEVNHINGDKTDNRVTNLEWVTSKENTQHALATGLQVSLAGTECQQSKLTEEDVRYIRSVFKPFDRAFGTRALAKKFNVHHSTISDVVNFVSYK